jgi:hypothetical protein
VLAGVRALLTGARYFSLDDERRPLPIPLSQGAPKTLFVPWLGKGAGQDRFFTPVTVREEASYVLTDI